MKIVFFFTFLLSILNLNSQSWSNPIDIGGNYSNGSLSSIQFINQTGWAVGYNQLNPNSGNILKTTDGGVNWITLPLFRGNYFKRLSFLNENLGWVVGENGTIIKTLDGGNNWIDQSIPGKINVIYAIATLDNQKVFIGGDSGFFKTIDGGSTWTKINKNFTNNIQFTSANIGYYITSGSNMFKTIDAGATWLNINSAGFIWNFNFFNDSIGWRFGQNGLNDKIGVIYKTTNGGTSWTAQANTANSYLSNANIISKDTVIIIGELGVIMQTTNGGTNWTRIQGASSLGIAEPALLFSIAGNSANNIWIVGDRSYMRQSTDAGSTWQNKIIGSRTPMQSVQFCKTDKNKVCAVGQSVFKAFLSNDAGKNWTKVTNPPGLVLSSSYLNPNSILVSSDSGIYLSADQGTTWVKKYSMTPSNAIYNLHFFDANTGWAVGNKGLILKTTDGGNTWVNQTSGTTKFLNSLYFTSVNNGFAVGDSNIVLKTTNGGNSWTINSSPSNLYFNDVYFTDPSNGWIVGSNGGVFKTTDGGLNWTTINIGSTDFLYGIRFRNSNEAWIYGEKGSMYYTSDAGSTWTKKTNPNINDILNMSFNSDGIGLLCGSYGQIKIYKCATLPPIAQDTHTLNQGNLLSSISISGTNIKWYSDSNKINPLPSNTTLVENTTYYASQTANGCESDLKKIVVKKCFTAVPTGNTTQNFAPGAKLSDLIVSGTNIKWYTTATKTNFLPSSTLLIDNTKYFASQTINNCESDVLTVLVKKLTVGISNSLVPNENRCLYNNLSNELTIKGKNIAESKINIVDITGKIVYTTRLSSETKINLSSFNKGIYFVIFDEENETYKLVIN